MHSLLTIAILLSFSNLATAESLGVADGPGSSITSACNDSNKIYKTCRDQKGIYDEKMGEAKKAKKPLIVVYGSNWCPRCKLLHGGFEAIREDKPVVAEIGLLNEYERIASGDELLKQSLKKSNAPARLKVNTGRRPIPMVFVVDPESGKARFLKLEQLFDRRNGHSVLSREKLAKALRCGLGCSPDVEQTVKNPE